MRNRIPDWRCSLWRVHEVGEGVVLSGNDVNPNAEVVPGWYPDPEGRPADRWWDGAQWTERTRPSTSAGLSTGGRMNAPAVGSLPQNGMGTAALTLGIVGLFAIPLVASVLAIIFGNIGMSRADAGIATNRGAAKAGFILGIIGLVLALILLIIIYNDINTP